RMTNRPEARRPKILDLRIKTNGKARLSQVTTAITAMASQNSVFPMRASTKVVIVLDDVISGGITIGGRKAQPGHDRASQNGWCCPRVNQAKQGDRGGDEKREQHW